MVAILLLDEEDKEAFESHMRITRRLIFIVRSYIQDRLKYSLKMSREPY